MICCEHLRLLIIRPVLEEMGLWSPVAENLLLGTAAQESSLGFSLRQIGGGPALGIYQIEPSTHDDLWKNWLAYRDKWSDFLLRFSSRQHWRVSRGTVHSDELIGNLFYATAVARLLYFRQPDPLPDSSDPELLGKYYKKIFNTIHGAATVEEFVKNYRVLVVGQ